MKKPLALFMILLVFCLGLSFVVAGCGSTSNQTNVTVYGEGTDERSAAAKLADSAIAALTKSAAIDTPVTREDDVLVVGCDADSPPLEYRATVITFEAGEQVKTGNEIVGFEVDLCKAVAKKMGLDVRFVKTAWNDLVPALQSGQTDIVMAAMATSADLLGRLDATDPYLAADLAICSSVDHRLANEGALKGKTVGVQLGTPAQSVVENIEGVGEIRTYSHLLGAFDDLTSGKLDAVIAEEPVGVWILENDTAYEGKYAVTGRLETGDGYAFWCKQGNAALLDAMNKALQELRDEGVYLKICAKWDLTGN